jgi:hypothetical protein
MDPNEKYTPPYIIEFTILNIPSTYGAKIYKRKNAKNTNAGFIKDSNKGIIINKHINTYKNHK